MGFSSGVWTPPSLPGSWSPAVSGQAATPTDWNTLLAGIATGLSTTICRDGQSSITADIPFGGFRLKAVGNGILLTDAATVGQLQSAAGAYAPDTGTADNLCHCSRSGDHGLRCGPDLPLDRAAYERHHDADVGRFGPAGGNDCVAE